MPSQGFHPPEKWAMGASLRRVCFASVVTLLFVLSAGLFVQPVTRMVAATSPGTNVPIVGESSPDRQQVEPTIVVDPRNPSIIVAGAQDLRLKSIGQHRWQGYYRSTDGGQTWSSSLLPGYPGDNSPEGERPPFTIPIRPLTQ